MNKKIKKIIQSKASKRIISGLTAFMLFAGVLPLGEIKEELNSLSSSISVSAADLTQDDPNTLFQHGDDYTLSVKIDNLVAYSRNCQLYPLYHQNDIVTIEQSDDTSIGTDYYTAGFQGLGHTEYPFAGKLYIQANTIIVLNLDGPLFNCVYDSVTLENINRISSPFEISRYYGRDDISKTTALLATEVRPDPEGKASATWNVSITSPSAPSDQNLDQFGGIIGQMSKIGSDSSELTVNVTMNAVGSDTEAIDIKGDNKGSRDLGFVCGVMEENTNLSFSFTSDRGINEISSSSGHVGGLVGYMKPGSDFSYTGANIQADGNTIKTSATGKYAGGIVGYNNGGTVTLSEDPYPVKQVISGKGGAGGVYGYYEPTSAVTIDVSKYEIDCQVNGNGNIGGLFGMLTSADNISIVPGTSPEIIKTSHASDAANYGGLIGYYLPIVSDSDPSDEIIPPVLSIGAVETDTDKVSGTVSSYGGGIGKIESVKTVDEEEKAIPSYVKFDGLTVSSSGAGNLTYGGLVATADNSFIDANNVTITAADYKGGGLIGHIESGVLRLTGKTDLTGASPAFKDENIYIGQIVGYRDDTLVFAEPGWQLHRCSSSIEIDDIGSWGQVLRFSDKSTTPVTASGDTPAYNITAECYRTEIENDDPVIETILSINELTHKITIDDPSDTYLTISSIGDFAKTALCFQIDETNNLFVSFSNTDYDCSSIYSEDIALSADVDLSGSGLIGLTRDNDVDGNKKNCTYSGVYSAPGNSEGEYYTISLAIGEPYGYRSNTKITAHNSTKGAGKNYRHQYIGLFGILDGGTVQYASFDGDIYVDSNREMYVGSAVGSAKGDITVEYAEASTAIHHSGSGNLYAGTLIGEASSEIGTITVSNSAITANISGTASSKDNLYLGGVIGRINYTSNTAVDSWSFSDLTIGGTISNTTGVEYNKIGGLIAGITHCSAGSSPNSRQLKLSNITLQNLDISGTAKSGSGTRTMGGLLGYSWLNVDADFDQIVIDDDCSITLTGAAENCGDLAGLVYNGTGHWTVKGDEENDESPDAVSETEVDENDNPLYLGDIRIGNITVNSTNAKSFGMFVNKAWYSPSANYRSDNGSSALYLELYQSKNDYVSADVYKIATPVFSMPSNPDNMVYDEIVAYSAYFRDDGATRYTADASGDPYVLKNGNAVISIGTSSNYAPFKTDGENASNTYKAQTSRGLKPNPNTRYYYDLNTVIGSNALMNWALKQYAHQSIKGNFNSTWTAIQTGTYDLKNISWYPVDIDGSIKINSTPTITFYNKELELSESINGSYARTSLYDYDNDMTTQHYLMHCGLFRNVNSGTLSINAMKFRGNVGYTIKKVVSTDEESGKTTVSYESDGSGMLVCGILSGKSETNKTTVTVNGTNYINLEGAYVHGLATNSYNLNTEYAPLLINKVGSNVNLTIKNIRTSSTNSGVNSYNKASSAFKGTRDENGYPKAASSLIGDVGLDESASGIDLVFSNIMLDGRTIALQGDTGTTYNGQLNTAYRTERTIFTRATLLNKFQYDSGSGIYNFEHDSDWSSDTIPAHTTETSAKCVTYGEELGNTKADNANTEYPDEERKYYGSSTIYTNPVNSNDTDGTYAAYFRTGFLPYVYTPYDKEDKTHQLQVNHGSTKFDGCGTYNDPYELSTAEQLGTISKILHGTHTTSDEFFIYVPTVAGYYTSTTDAESGIITVSAIKNNTWCTDKDTSHTKFYCTDGANGYYYADVNGDGDYDDAGDMFISGDELRKYLAGAYFQIKGTATPADMTLTDSNFPYGLGATSDEYAVFRGVIDGNNKSIINQSSNALIENSYGCVVKDLDIQVDNNLLRVQQNDVETFNLSGGCKAYGAVIAKIFGGDNIIDGVTVSFSTTTRIRLSNSSNNGVGKAQLIPVGGYIGVIIDGGLIFRGMDNKSSDALKGISSGIVFNQNGNGTDYLLSDNWLYVNPIIGRVMNGYAVTETTAYRPFEKGYRDNADGSRTYWINGEPVSCTAEELEADETLDDTKQTLSKGVTMCNGTKNYSITDINKNEASLLSVGTFSDSKTTVTIPNAQAMFIMSALIQSSATITAPSANPTLTATSGSYDGAYKTIHYADYDQINQTSDVTASSISDFNNLAVNDSASISNIPFVVKKYTVAISGKYNVLCLTNNASSCDFVLTGTEDHWYLPDGFKGIGSIGYGKTDSSYISNRTISLHKFSGMNDEDKEVAISLNMTLKHYEENGSTFKDNYFPISKSGIDNNESSIGGFGLFNTVRHNRTGTPADDDEICDLKISGLIDYDVIKQSSNWTYNKTNVGKYQYLNVGGIAGCMGTGADTDKDNIRIKRIDVSGLTVNGFATAGGFFGYVNMASDDDYSVEISEISATKFTVTAKRYSGGIIGYFGQGNLAISDIEITAPNVLTYYYGKENKDFDNGVGGIIGFVKNTSSNTPVILNDITLGSSGVKGNTRIGYKDGLTYPSNYDDVVSGGLIGRIHTAKNSSYDYTIKLTGCYIYNVDIYGHRVGGLIGGESERDGGSYVAIYGSHVICDQSTTAVVYGVTKSAKDRACAGLIGAIWSNSFLVVDTCSVEGYNLQGLNDTAGVCANAQKAGGGITVRNFKISDVKIQSDYSASLFGYLNMDLNGYNILVDNVQFIQANGNATTTGTKDTIGFLVAKNNGKTIKIAGFSRKNEETIATGYYVPQNMLGTTAASNSKNYGSNGYVIFADYNNAAETTSGTFKQEKTFANVNDGSNVKDYNENTVTDNFPYVTSSPKMAIDAPNNDTPTKYLSGDMMTAYGFTGSALSNIISDIDSSSVGYYDQPKLTAAQMATVKSHISTTADEFNVTGLPNFPLLVVDDTDYNSTTELINNCLWLLTNTGAKRYNSTSDVSKTTNWAANVSGVYAVNLYKYRFDASTRTFSQSGTVNSTDVCLRKETINNKAYFRMYANNVDTQADGTAQITLMDVQFKDPSNNDKVAYHLYVPIYVKKILQYNFRATLASNTDYLRSIYTTNRSNTLFENIGNPVTLEFEFEYTRTTNEWKDALNGGDSVMTNYYKSLYVDNHMGNWPSGAKMVLVDANNNDKAYYNDSGITATSGRLQLDLESFEGYTPAPLNNIMTITVTSGSGNLRSCSASEATVRDKDGNYYKYDPSGSGTKYAVTDVTIQPEIYYLSIFTSKNDTDTNIYHYTFYSKDKFDKHDDSDTLWRPNKIASTSPRVNLYMGNLYDNDIRVNVESQTGSDVMGSDNLYLDVSLTAQVSLKKNAVDNYIPDNMKDGSYIYQTFLMTYDLKKTADGQSIMGIQNKNAVNIAPDYRHYYLAAGKHLTDFDSTTATELTADEYKKSDNNIELRNNQNLVPYLKLSSNEYAATLQSNFRLVYDTQTLSDQFPKRINTGDDVGSKVIGYSNISSSAESAAYSSTYKKGEYGTRYYVSDPLTADLQYNVVETPNEIPGKYSYLGINAVEEGNNAVFVDTYARYDTSMLKDTNSYDYIELSLQLSNKDNYSRSLEISKYLTGLKIYGKNNTVIFDQDSIIAGTASSVADVSASISSDGKTYKVRVKKSLLQTQTKDDETEATVFVVPIKFNVYTGDSKFNDNTETDENEEEILTGLMYSNYKVSLHAEMYGVLSSGTVYDVSQDDDHLIYTNTKIIPEVIQ